MPHSREPERAAPDLRLEGVQVIASGGRVLLDIPHLSLRGGDWLALTGPSGAGKTTLLHTLSGLIRPTRGRVLWGGRDLATLPPSASAQFRREHLGLIFQDSHLFDELSAAENVALPAAFAPRARRGAIRARAAGWLDRMVPETSEARRSVASFSGGERQRIAVARALACDPTVILADEPTAALDRANADALGTTLLSVAAKGARSLIIVTHDSALAAQMGRVITLADGRIDGDSNA